MKKIKSGDKVIVVASKHKGKISKVTKVDGEKVYVENVNVAKKWVKGQGFQEITHPIHISNIMHYDEEAKKPSRVKITIGKDGKKKRQLVKSGKVID